jgi:hypothetical protein
MGHQKSLYPASISILSPGLCTDETQFQTPDMTVAVLPNDDHVLGRCPLEAEPPLPWPRFYQPCIGAEFPHVRIRTRRLDCRKTWQLSHDEWERAGMLMFEDEGRRLALAKTSSGLFSILGRSSFTHCIVVQTKKQRLLSRYTLNLLLRLQQ